jgi:ariadne-1
MDIGEVRLLLQVCNWDVERLLERYYSGDADALFREAGVVVPGSGGAAGAQGAAATSSSHKRPREDEVSQQQQQLALSSSMAMDVSPSASAAPTASASAAVCPTCYEPATPHMAALSCGHSFCEECWDSYLRVKITSEGQATRITCPWYKCPAVVPDSAVSTLLKDEAAKALYPKLAVESYVRSNKLLKWCPGPGCTLAVRLRSAGTPVNIACPCGYEFCFGCSQPPHLPATCTMLAQWKAKLISDEGTSKWLQVHTRPCPKCTAPIHKDGGCQYVSCATCQHRFCWLCMKSFDHRDHVCNQLVEQPEASKARNDLNKYTHFFNRFMIHQESGKSEPKLLLKLDKVARGSGQASIDTEYLNTAVRELFKARKVLCHSYIYGYYLPERISRLLFEDLQASLESVVERLHQILEGPAAGIDRPLVIDLAANLKTRLNNLLVGLANEDIVGEAEKVEKYDEAVKTAKSFIYLVNQPAAAPAQQQPPEQPEQQQQQQEQQ